MLINESKGGSYHLLRKKGESTEKTFRKKNRTIKKVDSIENKKKFEELLREDEREQEQGFEEPLLEDKQEQGFDEPFLEDKQEGKKAIEFSKDIYMPFYLQLNNLIGCSITIKTEEQPDIIEGKLIDSKKDEIKVLMGSNIKKIKINEICFIQSNK